MMPSEVRWIVYVARPAATITAPDQLAAERLATEQFGHAVVRVQSVVSAAIGEAEETAARRRGQVA